MKKVMLLVLTVMLVSAFLMASGPSLRVVKLTVINKSGNEVMIKLEGSDIGKQFYYLTIPAGTKDWPTVEVFTVLEDVYTRTTWYGEGDVAACVGMSSSGLLIMDRNNRLTFTPCYTRPMRTLAVWEKQPDGKMGLTYSQVTNSGEPSMEKVVYYVDELVWVVGRGDKDVDTSWDTYSRYGTKCGNTWIYWDHKSVKVPYKLCQWRYTY